jgi:hypothetical protein
MSDAQPPNQLDGARVVTFAVLEGIKPSGRTIHSSQGGVLPPPRALAICQYPGESGWYLFYCDGHWNVLTDTFHVSEGEAKQQAEFEFQGVGALLLHAV